MKLSEMLIEQAEWWNYWNDNKTYKGEPDPHESSYNHLTEIYGDKKYDIGNESAMYLCLLEAEIQKDIEYRNLEEENEYNYGLDYDMIAAHKK